MVLPYPRWRERGTDSYQYHIPGYAVCGTVWRAKPDETLHLRPGEVRWGWEARVLADCTLRDRETRKELPTLGLAVTLEGAKRLVETTLAETRTILVQAEHIEPDPRKADPGEFTVWTLARALYAEDALVSETVGRPDLPVKFNRADNATIRGYLSRAKALLPEIRDPQATQAQAHLADMKLPQPKDEDPDERRIAAILRDDERVNEDTIWLATNLRSAKELNRTLHDAVMALDGALHRPATVDLGLLGPTGDRTPPNVGDLLRAAHEFREAIGLLSDVPPATGGDPTDVAAYAARDRLAGVALRLDTPPAEITDLWSALDVLWIAGQHSPEEVAAAGVLMGGAITELLTLRQADRPEAVVALLDAALRLDETWHAGYFEDDAFQAMCDALDACHASGVVPSAGVPEAIRERLGEITTQAPHHRWPTLSTPVRRFAEAMEAALIDHDEKHGGRTWKGRTGENRLLHEARIHLGLLDRALRPNSPDPDALRREGANIANYAMMILDITGVLDNLEYGRVRTDANEAPNLPLLKARYRRAANELDDVSKRRSGTHPDDADYAFLVVEENKKRTAVSRAARELSEAGTAPTIVLLEDLEGAIGRVFGKATPEDQAVYDAFLHNKVLGTPAPAPAPDTHADPATGEALGTREEIVANWVREALGHRAAAVQPIGTDEGVPVFAVRVRDDDETIHFVGPVYEDDGEDLDGLGPSGTIPRHIPPAGNTPEYRAYHAALIRASRVFGVPKHEVTDDMMRDATALWAAGHHPDSQATKRRAADRHGVPVDLVDAAELVIDRALHVAGYKPGKGIRPRALRAITDLVRPLMIAEYAEGVAHDAIARQGRGATSEEFADLLRTVRDLGQPLVPDPHTLRGQIAEIARKLSEDEPERQWGSITPIARQHFLEALQEALRWPEYPQGQKYQEVPRDAFVRSFVRAHLESRPEIWINVAQGATEQALRDAFDAAALAWPYGGDPQMLPPDARARVLLAEFTGYMASHSHLSFWAGLSHWTGCQIMAGRHGLLWDTFHWQGRVRDEGLPLKFCEDTGVAVGLCLCPKHAPHLASLDDVEREADDDEG